MIKTNKTPDYLDPVSALEVTQGETQFYVFAIPAKTLLDVSYTSERTQYNRTGIQRGLRPDRLNDIGKFLSNATTPPLLPNAIIVSLSDDSYFQNNQIFIRNRQAGEAFVIDGQHRLWAFGSKYSGGTDLNVVVVAFINLDDAAKAEIFSSINGNQRKIHPSLVYDLIPMLRNTNAVSFEDMRCQDIVNYLNSEPESPWKDRISMVGAGDRIISQSSFITALKKLFKKGHIFAASEPENSDFFEERMQYEVLLEYFKAIQKVYSVEWDNKAYFLCKYVGIAALLRLLEKIIDDLRRKKVLISDSKGLQINESHFSPYISKIRPFAFSSAEEKKNGISYVGESGVSELAKRVVSKVFGEEHANNS